ncbi:hypothetical protein C5167_011085 [Papaver somniferum]|uniref:pectinesterase n=1 Tax=Papaver somniferum TaxID=3469 RepID=A0A4Y7K648_PAPSO|nr:probable pectinesterase/pectinesterase inhibitor 51 [Papaver somniferum]RZC67389.1 hypothetical protein C5167_011085 [Papaver somniferum]
MPRKPLKPFSSPSSSCILKKRKILLISMASFLILTIFSLILFFSLSPSSATHRHHHLKPPPSPPQQNQLALSKIELSCNATRYPEICKTSLSQSGNLPQDPKPVEIIQAAISISTQNLKTAQSMVKSIIDDSLSNPNRSAAANNCIEFLHNSEYRLTSANDVLQSGRIKDARAWMSAALLYQYDSWSALKYVNDSQLVNRTMSFMDSLMGFTSNALSMVVSYDLFGDEIASWKPPKTERDGFWENNNNSGGGGVGLSTKGGCPSDLTVDVTVCKEDGVGCKYNKIQDAVDAAPDNNGEGRFVIKIKQGRYQEIVRVPLEKKNVVFLGEGMGKTVISGSLSVQQPGLSTYNTATVGVSGDGFMARDITFENAAGGEQHQAVAFRSDSDLSVIENCEFLGNQDTVYAHSLRQFYKSCRIQGNVDFIFGNSAAIFQDSVILVCPRQRSPEKGEDNAVTAHGRTDPAQSTGFVFQNCLINGTDEYMDWYYKKPKVHKNYLGRPWKEYSRTVFLNCYFGEIVSPQGWMPWTGDFALSTLYYGEFENTGPGANISGRVGWSSQVPGNHVLAYSVQNFIQGDEWIPGST